MAAYLERGRKQPSEKAVPKRVLLAQSSWRAALSPFHPVAFSQSASSGARSSPPHSAGGSAESRVGWEEESRESQEQGGRREGSGNAHTLGSPGGQAGQLRGSHILTHRTNVTAR